MSAVDDYLDGIDPSARAALEHIRSLVTATVSGVEEGTSYGMPALKYKKKPLLGFIVAKDHLSVFPFSPRAIDASRPRLGGFELSKGTIRFSVGHPIPDDVLRTSSTTDWPRSMKPLADRVTLSLKPAG